MVELTAVERELLAAVEAGRRLNLHGRGRPIEHADMDGWGAEREVRAEVVRDILLGRAGGTPDPRGLRLRGARIVGRLDLDGVRIGVWLSLHDCDLVQPVRLRGAELPLLDLNGCRIAGLDAENLHVDTVVLLRDGFASAGQVSLIGARIGGKLDLYGAQLNCATDTALAATGLQVGGSVYLNGRLTANGRGMYGAVRLVGARIGGTLSLRGAQLHNPDGPALVADNLRVEDMLTMSGGLQAHGAGTEAAVRLVAARISGAISFGGAVLSNETGPALAAHYLDAGGTVYLDGLRATGMILLAGARIGGRLDLSTASVISKQTPALDATRLEAGHGVVARDATLLGCDQFRGAVHLRGARIGGDVDLRLARVSNTGGGAALRASQAIISGQLMINTMVVESGIINLRGAQLGALRDDPARLPPHTRLAIDGLTYRGLPGARRVDTVPVEQRVAWLGRTESYAAQPYRQLAAAYQAAGHEDDARRILIAQQQRLLDSGLLGGWSRVRRRMLGLTLGYGYESWRAVVGLVLTLLTAAILLTSVGGATARVGTAGVARTGPPERCAVVERLGLALDETVPLVDTGARNRCDLNTTTGVGQAVALATLVLRLLGWGFATLVVAGYSGLVRRN